VFGITYNFLPFMTLPLYVALEKIDKRLIEAAEDLYAGSWRPQGTIAGLVIGGVLGFVVGSVMEYGPITLALPFAIAGALIGTFLISQAFIRVTLPLAMPGIFAGSLLTFIPAVGDFVNAELLGNPQSLMIGNVIQARYLQVTDYPTASALSFVLMLAILIGLLIYIRLLGTEELTGASI
jgi:spermidine/putrescine transport system permease protein